MAMTRFFALQKSIPIIGFRSLWTNGKLLSEQSENINNETKDKTDNDKRINDKGYENNLEKEILNASLQYVHELGWSQQAISAGAESIGYPGVIHGMFPNGGAELVHHFNSICNDELAKILKEKVSTEQEITPVKNKTLDFQVYDALESRIEMIIPYKRTWPQALGLLALPQNVPTALNNLSRMVDDVCYYTGDRSVNFDWYAKRLAVATIYKSTELYMLQDTSENHKETWQFLKRRIEDASVLRKALERVSNVPPSQDVLSQTMEMAQASYITVRNMLGLNWKG